MRYVRLGMVLAACAATLVLLRPNPGIADAEPPFPVFEPDLHGLSARLDAQLAETERLAASLEGLVLTGQVLAEQFAQANPTAPPEQVQEAASAVMRNSGGVFTPALLMSWLWEESHYRFHLVSRADARGIAQIRPRTGRWIATEMVNVPWDPDRLQDPGYSIDLGAGYLRWLYDRYDGDLHKTFTAYNRGIVGVEEYIAEHGSPVSRYSSCILSRVGLDDGERCRTRTKAQEGE